MVTLLPSVSLALCLPICDVCNITLYLLNCLFFSHSDFLSFFVIILPFLIPCSCVVRKLIRVFSIIVVHLLLPECWSHYSFQFVFIFAGETLLWTTLRSFSSLMEACMLDQKSEPCCLLIGCPIFFFLANVTLEIIQYG